MKNALFIALACSLFACGASPGGTSGVGSGGDAPDASSADNDLAATLQDLAGVAVDLGSGLADGSTEKTGCNGLRSCELACKTDKACGAACRANATSSAKKLYQALLDCHDAACGKPTNGMCTPPCDCRKMADAPGGACDAQYNACVSDLP
jgi:hypothetical protein